VLSYLKSTSPTVRAPVDKPVPMVRNTANGGAPFKTITSAVFLYPIPIYALFLEYLTDVGIFPE
jgi:hypothetical protein